MSEDTQEQATDTSVEDGLRYELAMRQKTIDDLQNHLLQRDETIRNNNIRIEALSELRGGLGEQLLNAHIQRKSEIANIVAQANNGILTEQQNAKIAAAGQHQRYTALQAELTETQENFGRVKHKQKQAEAKVAELVEAIDWFLNVSANFNGRIETALDELEPALTLADLIAASLKHPLLRTSTAKLTAPKIREIFNK